MAFLIVLVLATARESRLAPMITPLLRVTGRSEEVRAVRALLGLSSKSERREWQG